MVNLMATMQPLSHELEATITSSLIYAFSPIAKVEQLSSDSYLITITDKNGTTTAIVPIISEQTIDSIINNYFEQHPILQELIERHNQSQEAHEYIRSLIQDAIDGIPTRVSQLQNDEGYIKNFKEMLIFYPSYWEFPNIPSDEEKDMIFVDESTGDMFVFGLNNTAAYTSIGISNQDAVYGGDSGNN